MMAFIENSSRRKRMRRARSDSSSHDSCAISDQMILAGAEKVTLMWGIDIPWPIHFLFFHLEAWKSSSSEGCTLDQNLLCCPRVQSKQPSYFLQHRGCHAPNPKGSKAWERHLKVPVDFFFLSFLTIQSTKIISSSNIKNYHNNSIEYALKVSQSSKK